MQELSYIVNQKLQPRGSPLHLSRNVDDISWHADTAAAHAYDLSSIVLQHIAYLTRSARRVGIHHLHVR